MENRARRSYVKKWGNVAPMQLRALYHPDELNRQLEEQQLHTPELLHSCYNYTGHGDSYFVSREMYEALVATCRCGRQRRGTHVLKCLQREQEKYSGNTYNEEKEISRGERERGQVPEGERDEVQQQQPEDSAPRAPGDPQTFPLNVGKSKAHLTTGQKTGCQVPETSNAFIGWRTDTQPPYCEWEKSTRYVSPVLTMPGPRITAVPYNAIIIG